MPSCAPTFNEQTRHLLSARLCKQEGFKVGFERRQCWDLFGSTRLWVLNRWRHETEVPFSDRRFRVSLWNFEQLFFWRSERARRFVSAERWRKIRGQTAPRTHLHNRCSKYLLLTAPSTHYHCTTVQDVRNRAFSCTSHAYYMTSGCSKSAR